MKFFTRLLLTKKNVKVNEIPKDLLTYKSQNPEIEEKLNQVELYYLDNGTKLMSLLKDTNNNKMEVINILNSLDDIFHVKFDNVFIRKSDNKLLGFSYPLVIGDVEPKFDMEKLAKIIVTPNDPEDLQSLLNKKDIYTENEASSILINTIFWYKLFKYLNSKNISVKNLSLDNIIEYNESYSSKYIFIMNTIVNLDILESYDIEEEIELVNLCIKYFLNAAKKKVFSSSFYAFIDEFNENYKLFKSGNICSLSFFENMDFLSVFYNQCKRIVTFDCDHESDKSFYRCPICNDDDKVLTKKQYIETFKKSDLILDDDEFSVYIDMYGSCNILIKNRTKLKLESIHKYIKNVISQDTVYRYIYNENSEWIAVNFYSAGRIGKINDIDVYLDTIINYVKKGYWFHELCDLFCLLKNKIQQLYNVGLTLDIVDKLDYKEVLNNFWLVDKNTSKKIDVKFPKLTLMDTVQSEHSTSYDDELNTIITNIFFNLIKEKCNSILQDGNVVSNNDFDIINLFNLKVVSEYKKFLRNEAYDSNTVMKCLEDFSSEKYPKDYTFDASYVISPKLFNSVLEEEFDSDKIKHEYEFISKEIVSDRDYLYLLLRNFKRKDIILPEYIVYSVENGEVVYKGYWIKKQEKNYVKEAFFNRNLEKMNNKEVIHMVLTYYKYMNKNFSNVPVDILCFDPTYSKIFIRYRSIKKVLDSKRHFFGNVLNILKDSSMYFSDMIQIIESDFGYLKVEKAITEIYNSFTNYCEVHKCWYEETLSKCPVCSKYYEFINIKKICDKKSVLYENELYKLVSYKSKLLLKLYKFKDESTLVNGKNVQELENQILSLLKNQVEVENIQMIKKIVKESDSGKVVGVLVPKNDVNLKSIYDVLTNSSVTNLTYIDMLLDLLISFNNIYYAFSNIKVVPGKVEDLLKYNFFYSSAKKGIYVSDYEFLPDLNFSKSNINLINSIRNLDKLVKYILSINKKCYDLRAIAYPEISLNYTDELYNILYDLRKYYSNKNAKFCDKHYVYYNTEDGMCPLCMDEMDEIHIKKITDRGKQVNFGGEAFIYSMGLSTLVKAYKKSKVASDNKELKVEIQKALDEDDRKKSQRRESVLKIIKELYSSTKEELEDKEFIIPFPKKLVYAGEQKKFMGFAQDKVQDAMSFFLFTNTKHCEELGFTTPLSLLELLIGYGEGIEYLHNSKSVRKVTPDGIVLGDVSGRNVLYSKYLKKVAIIDMDSVGIKGYPACTLTDDYSDPLTVRGNAIIKNFSFDSDWYSYAIICFYILTKVHPFDGVYDNRYDMTIPERKEKKISVLGIHKDLISLPSVVADWSWMPDYLLNAFIDIFENEKRFSILNLLKRAYNEISGVEKYQIDLENKIGSSLESTLNEITSKENDGEIEKSHSKKSTMNMKILVEMMPDSSLKNVSSDLIIENGNIYYKSILENNILCDETLFFKAINYDSQDHILKNSAWDFEEIYVKDGKGIATVVDESNEKYIGLISDNAFTKIYRISDVNRKFIIFHDALNTRYLLVARDNSKSYVIKDNKIFNYSYSLDTTEFAKIFENEFYEPKVAYIGNSMYFAKDGYIGRLDLNSGAEVKIDCPLVTKDSAIKVFSDAIVIITHKEILKISMK